MTPVSPFNSKNFEWNTSQIRDFQHQVEIFKSYRKKEITQDNFQKLFEICYLLIDRIPLPVTLINSPIILRGRSNEDNEIFSREQQISYNSERIDLIELGRFNRPRESMFYGSLPDEIDHLHFGAAAALECCKSLVDPNNRTPFQYITFGKWKVNKPFYAINFCNDTKLLSNSPNLKAATLKHEELIHATFPGKPAFFIIEFWRFISELAGRKQEVEQDHFLTTALICAIIKYREVEMMAPTAGAIFPSTMTDNEGINIVLTRQAVDNLLELKTVHMAKFVRRVNNPKAYDIFQCTDEVAVINRKFVLVKKF